MERFNRRASEPMDKALPRPRAVAGFQSRSRFYEQGERLPLTAAAGPATSAGIIVNEAAEEDL